MDAEISAVSSGRRRHENGLEWRLHAESIVQDRVANKQLDDAVIFPPNGPHSGFEAHTHQEEEEEEEEVDVPPNGGYGWVVVLCSFLINAHTWGLNSVSHQVWNAFSSSTAFWWN
jgi:hypothetical protein